MTKVQSLLLDTKALIPFPAAGVTIYQPSLKEIAMIGGDVTLIIGAEALSKDYLKSQDNLASSGISNFEILMKIIKANDEQNKQIYNCVMQVLTLLFIDYKIMLTPASIILQDNDNQMHIIDKNNFDELRKIIYDMFCLAEIKGEQGDDYNPAGDRARALVEKFKAKRKMLAELRHNKEQENESIFGRYINILAVGLKLDKQVLSNYSVYQLTESFKRFQLKEGFDYTLKAKLAGATKVKDPKDWMGSIKFGRDTDDTSGDDIDS